MSKSVWTQAIKPDRFPSFFGGRNGGEIYVSGAGYIWLEDIPADIAKFMEDGGPSTAQINELLQATLTEFTPVGVSIDSIEHSGQGGLKSNYPGTTSVGATSLSPQFVELDGTPVAKAIRAWRKLIRSYSGAGGNFASGGSKYSKAVYAATLYYWTANPGGQVQFAQMYPAIWPKKDVDENFTTNRETNDKITHTIELSFDFMPISENWVTKRCEAFMKSVLNRVPKYDVGKRDL